MAISNPSGGTAFQHVINPEFIDLTFHTAVATPFVHEYVVARADVSGRATGTFAHPYASRMAAASAYSEGGEFSSTAVAFTNATTNLGYVLQSTFVPRQQLTRGLAIAQNAVAVAINRCTDSVMQKMEKDVMALATSMSVNSGSVTTVNDLDNWNTVLTAFRASAKRVSKACAVMHPDAIRDLHQDIVTSAAGLLGSSWGTQAASSTGGPSQGLRGTLDGVDIFESDAIPANSTGWENFITGVDPANPGLVMPINEMVQARVTEADDALGVWVAVFADYGVGIHEAARNLAFTTRT